MTNNYGVYVGSKDPDEVDNVVDSILRTLELETVNDVTKQVALNTPADLMRQPMSVNLDRVSVTFPNPPNTEEDDNGQI